MTDQMTSPTNSDDYDAPTIVPAPAGANQPDAKTPPDESSPSPAAPQSPSPVAVLPKAGARRADASNPTDDLATEAMPIDQTCIERVEAALDETELAIGLLEDQAGSTTTIDRRAPTTGRRLARDVLLSVIMPVYNERATIRQIVERVQAVELDLEIIIVDDYSVDGTRELLYDLEAEYPNVRILLHGYNQGKGAAVRTALERIRGDVVIIQDADLEYDPADYPALLQPILDGQTDVVYGSRFLGDEIRDPSRLHRLGNRLLTAASNLMTGQRLTDMETCYKVFRRSALRELTIRENRFGMEPEITARLSRLGHQIVEVPIAYDGRNYAAGKKIGLGDALAALWCIVRYRFAG